MANKKMNVKEAQSPIKGSFPNNDEILCKDCEFRDKTIVNIGNKKIVVGTTKAFCKKYPAPPGSNGKPHNVLFENGICEFYKKEEQGNKNK